MLVDTIAVFISGVFTGAVLVRYGFGLGVKAVMQIKEDLPLSEKLEPYPEEEKELQNEIGE